MTSLVKHQGHPIVTHVPDGLFDDLGLPLLHLPLGLLGLGEVDVVDQEGHDLGGPALEVELEVGLLERDAALCPEDG